MKATSTNGNLELTGDEAKAFIIGLQYGIKNKEDNVNITFISSARQMLESIMDSFGGGGGGGNDDGGDGSNAVSTAFYNLQGQFLGEINHFGSSNFVTFLNVNQRTFDVLVSGYREKMESESGVADDSFIVPFLMGLGFSYNIQEFSHFFDSNSKDAYTGKDFVPLDGIPLFNEHGFRLQINELGIFTMNGNFLGDPEKVQIPNDNYTSQAKGHLHVNEGRWAIEFAKDGTFKTQFGATPSPTDITNSWNHGTMQNKEHYFDVVIAATQIFFYNSKGTLVTHSYR